VQILVLAVVLWTRLICHAPLAVPIIAAYAGILVRCGITLTAFYVKVYPQLSKKKTVSGRPSSAMTGGRGLGKRQRVNQALSWKEEGGRGGGGGGVGMGIHV